MDSLVLNGIFDEMDPTTVREYYIANVINAHSSTFRSLTGIEIHLVPIKTYSVSCELGIDVGDDNDCSKFYNIGITVHLAGKSFYYGSKEFIVTLMP
jgi:hypothetical protein